MGREPDRADLAVERYLARVRAELRGLSGRERDDIVRELRSHVAERLEAPGAGVDEVLRGLGEPAALARRYRADDAPGRAAGGRSPLEVFLGLYRLRRRSVASFAAAVLAGLGYAWGFVLLGAAGEKVLTPVDVGLWYAPDRWLPLQVVVDGRGPAGSRELLGWWFVPAAALTGAALLVATNAAGRWWLRRARAAAAERA